MDVDVEPATDEERRRRHKPAFPEPGALLRECLRVQRETLGDRDDRTLVSISALGQVLQDVGKLEEAAPLCHEALQTRRETLGDRHPDTLVSIWSVCLLYQRQGKEEDAKRLCREAVDGAKAHKDLGPQHEHTKLFLDNPWGIR